MAPLGPMTEQPQTLARIMLRDLVMETGGEPDEAPQA